MNDLTPGDLVGFKAEEIIDRLHTEIIGLRMEIERLRGAITAWIDATDRVDSGRKDDPDPWFDFRDTTIALRKAVGR